MDSRGNEWKFPEEGDTLQGMNTLAVKESGVSEDEVEDI